MDISELIATITRIVATLFIYFVIGFGPGFIIGLLLANRFAGKKHQLRMEKQMQSIQKASEHNSQWHPNNTKWQ
jgi:hypothetical protein